MENKKMLFLINTVAFILQTGTCNHSATSATTDTAVAPTLVVPSNARTSLGDIEQTFASVKVVVDPAATGHSA